MKRIALLVVAISCLVWWPAYGIELEKGSLKGLEGVDVIVENLQDGGEAIGVSAASIEGDVERQLRLAGIRILTKRERLDSDRKPYLYINCNILYFESIGLVTFSIDVEAHQIAELRTGEDAQVLTWAKSYLGSQHKDRAGKKLREVVESFVDEFVADFLDVNRADTPPGARKSSTRSIRQE